MNKTAPSRKAVAKRSVIRVNISSSVIFGVIAALKVNGSLVVRYRLVFGQARAQVGNGLALASEVVDDVAREQRAFRRPGDGFLQVGAMRGLVRADAGDERGGEFHFGVIAAQRDRLRDQRVAVEIGRLFATAVYVSLLPRFQEKSGVEELQRIRLFARRLK